MLIENSGKTHTSTRDQISNLLQNIQNGLYDKQEAVSLALLCSIAGESIFLLGPPGVGKSLVARRLKFAFSEGKSFEYLMSKFSTPDEIFGPISIKKLRDEDKYERLTEKYLPGAHVVFLDEIWKAGPAIQNALLTILSEKIYRNGDKEIEVQIRGIITASNELPPKSENLAPIWDRFLIRLEVDKIKKSESFLKMILDTSKNYEDDIDPEYKLNDDTLKSWDKLIDQIEVPAEVLNTIQIVKAKISDHSQSHSAKPGALEIYDRRWKKIVRLLRTSAFLNGRTAVDLMDCFLMVHCLWENQKHKLFIEQAVSETIRDHGYSIAVNLQALQKEVSLFEQDVQTEINVNISDTREDFLLIDDEYLRLKEHQLFAGTLLKSRGYHELDREEFTIFNFYNEEKRLTNRVAARKSDNEFMLEVLYEAKVHELPLETQTKEHTVAIPRKPHDLVKKFWEEKYEDLIKYVDKQLDNCKKLRPTQLSKLRENFFVKEEYAELVESNFEHLELVLKKLKIRLEKARHSYLNLK